MGNQPSITVIVPTINAEKELPLLIERLHSQTLQADEIMVVDSASDDKTESICRNDPAVKYIRIKREEYDHGGTRDMAARKAAGDIVVFLTQDALPADDDFLLNLTSPIIKGEAAISTGRQLPRHGATRMEALVREFNYPAQSFFRSKDDIPRLGIKTFFSSDVCCAYDKEIFLKLGGFEHPLKTNEDMFFAAKAINNGYKVAYAADARVYHSHNFSLKEQYKRNYVQGYEIARHDELLSGVPLESEGMKLVKYVSKGLLKHGRIISFCHFGFDCVARLAGSKRGRAAYRKKEAHREAPAEGSGSVTDDATVCVLMSTYNGEKYLQQQIDSLYAQKDLTVRILVRDDGSSDATQSILTHNQESNNRFCWYTNGHLGSAASFLDLIAAAPEADYYALCDQDDVWDDDKLKCAVEMLAQNDQKKPLLYYSNLRVVDEDLGFHRNAHERPWVMKNKYSALVDVVATGCTMVFNRPLLELLRDRMPQACKMHDEWIYLVCRFFGQTIYDYEPHISYRQHSSNVLGLQLNKYSLSWLKRKIARVYEENWHPRSVNAQSFYVSYSDVLSEKDLKKVAKVAAYKGTIKGKIALLTDAGIHGRSLVTDLKYRLKVITGKA